MIRNILGAIVGFVVGNIANMLILAAGHFILPPPAGFDGTSMEGFASTIHLLRPVDFTVPFLAHAIGPLVGVLAAMFIVASRHKMIAIILGCLFLTGGIVANFMIPAPWWYRILDVTLAYVPMAYLGYKLSGKS